MFCCFPLVAVGDILSASAYFWAVFSVWGFVPPLVFEALTSFCWGFVLMLYQGFVLVFYIEASSSYFILRLWPRIILRLCPHILFWGFVLVLYWGFVLIFYFEALSSYFILRLRPHCFILRLCFSVRGFGSHCCRHLLLCLYYFFGLFAVICVWFCLFVFLCRVTRCQYYLVWISIHIFYLLCLFFSLQSCNPLFWFTCSYINFNLWFCWLPCFDMCGHYSPEFIVMRHCNVFLYASLSRSHHYS